MELIDDYLAHKRICYRGCDQAQVIGADDFGVLSEGTWQRKLDDRGASDRCCLASTRGVGRGHLGLGPAPSRGSVRLLSSVVGSPTTFPDDNYRQQVHCQKLSRGGTLTFQALHSSNASLPRVNECPLIGEPVARADPDAPGGNRLDSFTNGDSWGGLGAGLRKGIGGSGIAWPLTTAGATNPSDPIQS